MSAPKFGDPTLAKEDFSLRPVSAVQERMGLLFYRMESMEGEPSFDDFFGDLWEKVARVTSMDSLILLGTRSHQLRCNWKTYIENYSEGYHITAVHRGLSAAFDQSTYRVMPHPKYKYVEHLVEPIKGSAPTPYEGVWFFLWPNTALNVYRHGMTVEQVVPLTVNTCEIRYTDLIQRDATAEQIEQMRSGSDIVTKEDIQICESVQQGLESGNYYRGRLSPLHENGVAWFQQQYTCNFSNQFDIHDPCYNRGSAAH